MISKVHWKKQRKKKLVEQICPKMSVKSRQKRAADSAFILDFITILD